MEPPGERRRFTAVRWNSLESEGVEPRIAGRLRPPSHGLSAAWTSIHVMVASLNLALISRRAEGTMLVKDLMRRDVLTVHEDDLVEELLDALVGKNLHGAPVVSDEGDLVGMISQTDIHFGAMTRSRIRAAGAPESETGPLRVGEIMTSPPVSATEETRIVDLCKMMRRLRIHRVPIVRGTKVTGVISSLDICGAIARGEKLDG